MNKYENICMNTCPWLWMYAQLAFAHTLIVADLKPPLLPAPDSRRQPSWANPDTSNKSKTQAGGSTAWKHVMCFPWWKTCPINVISSWNKSISDIRYPIIMNIYGNMFMIYILFHTMWNSETEYEQNGLLGMRIEPQWAGVWTNHSDVGNSYQWP